GDCVDAAFHVPPGLTDTRLGDRLSLVALIQLFQPLPVKPQLGQRIDEFALFLAQVLAPDHGEKLAFLDLVAQLYLSEGGRAFSLRSWDRADLYDFAREARMHAGQMIGVERQRADERERPWLGGFLDLLRLNTESGDDIFREPKPVRTPGNQFGASRRADRRRWRLGVL